MDSPEVPQLLLSMGCFQFMWSILFTALSSRHMCRQGELQGDKVLGDKVMVTASADDSNDSKKHGLVMPSASTLSKKKCACIAQVCVGLSEDLEDVPQAQHGMLIALSQDYPSLVQDILWMSGCSLKHQYLHTRFEGEADPDELRKKQRQEAWKDLRDCDKWDFSGAYVLAEGEYDRFFFQMAAEDRQMRKKLGEDVIQLYSWSDQPDQHTCTSC